MILVTGGAGYIGSHYVDYAASKGDEVLVLDNLVYGHAEAVEGTARLIHGEMGDAQLLDEIFLNNKIEAVVHFAANAYVGESVTNPQKYYRNNTIAALAVLDAMVKHQVSNFIFSSTCATYGNPVYVPMDEAHPQSPINPYGESKLFVEKILKAYDRAYGLKYTALRYFNACGAAEGGRIGESHDPETHLIPLILQAAQGKIPSVKVFGTDYDTPDGTCIRDYIHVTDLAQAHSLAYDRLKSGAESAIYNLGTENGSSVREVIAVCEKVSGKPIPVIEEGRREGDPPRLVASAGKAKSELGWSPQNADLEKIIASAWQWEENRRY